MPRDCKYVARVRANQSEFAALFKAATEYANGSDRWVDVQPGYMEFHFEHADAHSKFYLYVAGRNLQLEPGCIRGRLPYTLCYVWQPGGLRGPLWGLRGAEAHWNMPHPSAAAFGAFGWHGVGWGWKFEGQGRFDNRDSFLQRSLRDGAGGFGTISKISIIWLVCRCVGTTERDHRQRVVLA